MLCGADDVWVPLSPVPDTAEKHKIIEAFKGVEDDASESKLTFATFKPSTPSDLTTHIANKIAKANSKITGSSAKSGKRGAERKTSEPPEDDCPQLEKAKIKTEGEEVDESEAPDYREESRGTPYSLKEGELGQHAATKGFLPYPAREDRACPEDLRNAVASNSDGVLRETLLREQPKSFVEHLPDVKPHIRLPADDICPRAGYRYLKKYFNASKRQVKAAFDDNTVTRTPMFSSSMAHATLYIDCEMTATSFLWLGTKHKFDMSAEDRVSEDAEPEPKPAQVQAQPQVERGWNPGLRRAIPLFDLASAPLVSANLDLIESIGNDFVVGRTHWDDHMLKVMSDAADYYSIARISDLRRGNLAAKSVFLKSARSAAPQEGRYPIDALRVTPPSYQAVWDASIEKSKTLKD
ncbi:hypothetical protein BDZ85DRAFT_279408 [Elsinoe ampelina]|uniref:Uncharacterized protein n=1 Tax=Elsinoe ampelina TaxID=302913 RepID=A0A6A6GJC5_9PEZI|nr:hypothetical protein BDZ85DRAFT_279408 [Elsinoe ampelina]